MFFRPAAGWRRLFEKDDFIEILVYAISGKLAHKQYFNVEKGARKIGFNVERLPAGTYFLQVLSRERNETEGFKLVTYK